MTLRKALYFENSDGKVKCLLCPHGCMLAEGKTGICKARINSGNELYTKAWGNLCSLSIDPIEKKPLFHFLPGSKTLSIAIEGCTFKCLNCQNYTISQDEPKEHSSYFLEPEEAVDLAILKKCNSISYTYSEPIVFFEYMIETARLAKQKGIKNIMVSNGYINEDPLNELCKYLDAANIDLKSFDDSTYRKLTGGSLEPVLNTLKVLKANNVWLEITNLIIPGWTDNMDSIRNMIQWLKNNGFPETPIHFSRFQPMYKLDSEMITPVETLLEAEEIAISAGLTYVYSGNMRSHSKEHTFCPECGNLLIQRNGFEILENRVKQGICMKCSMKIAGTWE